MASKSSFDKTQYRDNSSQTNEDVESITSQPTLQDPPDGGQGWLVVFGCFFVSCLFGFFIIYGEKKGCKSF